MFRLTFLGTSSGVPTAHRNVSAIALECLGHTKSKHEPWLLIDCGEGTQHQLLKTKLSLNDLSAILITHTHGDHCFGLAGLLASLGMYGRKKVLKLIAPTAIFEMLEVLTRVSDWHVNYPIKYIPIEAHLTNALSIQFGAGHQLSISIHPLSHRIPSYGFEICQILSKDKLLTDKLTHDNLPNTQWSNILKATAPLMMAGKIVNPDEYRVHETLSTKIVIAGDNDEPSLLSGAVKGCQALVHEATYTDDVHQKILAKPKEQGGFDPKHSSAKMVAKFAQMHQIPMLMLTHFSARYAPFEDETSDKPNMAHFRREVVNDYKGSLILAEDFLQVEIASVHHESHKNQSLN